MRRGWGIEDVYFILCVADTTGCYSLLSGACLLVVFHRKILLIVETFFNLTCEGTVALWLVHLLLDQVVQVRVLAGDIVFCSWARHFTLTEPFSTRPING